MATRPSITVTFRQLAASLIARSERGIAILILRDATDDPGLTRYKTVAEAVADSAAWTDASLQAIRDVFDASPYEVDVVRIGTAGTFADAAAIIAANIPTGWITVADPSSTDTSDIVSWIVSGEQSGATYKAVVYNASAPDCKHIVNFATTGVTFADGRTLASGATGAVWLPSLLGILAAANVTGSVTNKTCRNLSDCVVTADEAAAVAAGKLILTRIGGAVRIVCGCTSLTTTNGTTATEDMEYIETVEAMDMIADDIRAEFRNHYQGAYRNSYDNQMLFVGAVTGYLGDLETENILDPDYDNAAAIDVDAQRAAWIASGKSEAAGWSDAQVRHTPYKRTVFVVLTIKILGTMESLRVVVEMF